MKGLEISQDEFNAILNDIDWQRLIRFDDNKNVYIDLNEYSKLGHYLPIDSEYQSYLVGFRIMRELWKCPYRTQNEMVCIYPKKPKDNIINKPILREKRIPVFKPTKMGIGEASCSTTDDMKYNTVLEEVEIE